MESNRKSSNEQDHGDSEDKKKVQESSKPQNIIEETDDSSCIRRPSCGRVANIGDLYDARTEQFVAGFNIFVSNAYSSVITTDLLYKSSSNVAFSNNFFDKAAALNIDDELLLSILVGLVNSDFGFLKCLYETEAIQCSYVERIQTKKESIDIFDEKLKTFVVEDLHDSGTHIVVGITYGANISIMMTSKNIDEKAKLQMHMKSFLEELNPELQLVTETRKHIDLEEEKSLYAKINPSVNNLRLKVYTDVQLRRNKTLANSEDALKWVQFLRKQMMEGNVPGRQIEYYLMPLTIVKEVFNLQKTKFSRFSPVSDATPVIKYLEIMCKAFEDLQRFMHFVNDNKKNIPYNERNAIKKYFNQVEVVYAEVRQKSATLLVQARSGNFSITKIQDFIEKFVKESVASADKIYTYIESYEYLKDKIDFIKKCQKNGITIITEATEMNTVKIDNYEKEIYFSFFNSKNISQITPLCFYLHLSNNCSNFYLVDSDMLPDAFKNQELSSDVKIVKCFNGKYIEQEDQRRREEAVEKEKEIQREMHPCDFKNDTNVMQIQRDIASLHVRKEEQSRQDREFQQQLADKQIKEMREMHKEVISFNQFPHDGLMQLMTNQQHIQKEQNEKLMQNLADLLAQFTKSKNDFFSYLKEKPLHDIAVPDDMEEIILKAKADLKLDTANCYNFAFVGHTITGKRSLINALRGLTDYHPDAAAVGIKETTLETYKFPDPEFKHVLIYDVPSTLTFDPSNFYLNKRLCAFDCLIICIHDTPSREEIDLAVQCLKYSQPVAFVQSRCDNVLDSARKKKEIKKIDQNAVFSYINKMSYICNEKIARAERPELRNVACFFVSAYSLRDLINGEEPEAVYNEQAFLDYLKTKSKYSRNIV